MTKNKDKRTSAGNNLPGLKIGSRVRSSDDGVEGRIVWANAVAVKIQWPDGEQVTWKRDTLPSRPIEILDPVGEDDRPDALLAPAACESTATPGGSPAEPGTPTRPEPNSTPTLSRTVEQPAAALRFEVPEPTQEQTAAGPCDESASVSGKAKRQRKAPAGSREQKVSALDAAARVLAEEDREMTCREMIEAMAAKGYWTSPSGRTPQATLYSAIAREIQSKGDRARFRKTDRGKFARAEAE
jgi:hypothetical protein